MNPLLLFILTSSMVLAYPTKPPKYLVPIILSHSDTIRVFCFTDSSFEVSFSPDRKCEGSCGYIEGQRTCCKDFKMTENVTVIQCDQYKRDGNKDIAKSLQFIAPMIYPEDNVQVITEQNRSVLTCLDESQKAIRISHSTDAGLYMKFAYLYEGTAKVFDPFSTLKTVKLPANEATEECNKTLYKYQHKTPVLDAVSRSNLILTQLYIGQDKLHKKVEENKACLTVLILGISGLCGVRIIYMMYVHSPEKFTSLKESMKQLYKSLCGCTESIKGVFALNDIESELGSPERNRKCKTSPPVSPQTKTRSSSRGLYTAPAMSPITETVFPEECVTVKEKVCQFESGGVTEGKDETFQLYPMPPSP